MEKFLERTSYLLGEEACERLAEKHVAVFGIGGVGSYVAEALGRSGIGKLTLVDHDTVSESNINRQVIATYDTIGRLKTEVMAERLRSINPSIRIIEKNCFFLPETAKEFDFSEYDYVVDAVDTVTAKLEIITKAKKAGVPVISSMGTGNKLDPSKFEVTDISKTSVCPLAKVIRHELRRREIFNCKVLYSKEIPIHPQRMKDPFEDMEDDSVSETGGHVKQVPGSIAFVPSVAGMIIAGAVVMDLKKEEK